LIYPNKSFERIAKSRARSILTFGKKMKKSMAIPTQCEWKHHPDDLDAARAL
jgi:hypothetical protein